MTWFTNLEFQLNATTSRRDPLESNYAEAHVKPLNGFLRRAAAWWFFVTGRDLIERRLIAFGVRRGELMDRILFGRTGEIRNSVDDPRARNHGAS
jgi:hypothetical protein